MRCSFADDPTLSPRLFTLLDRVFPGIGGAAAHARRLGGVWEEASTPFVHFENGEAVAHVGVIELPLILMGKEARVGSIHGVAAHPDHRRRGHYRKVMEEALEHCAGRFATLVLTTEHPEYFSPFGFREVREHRFILRGMGRNAPGGARLLDLSDSTDIALLNRLLETREPVSRVVGVGPEKAVFCVNEGRRPLHYLPDLDTLLCLELEGRVLRLFDVVSPRLPALDAIVARLPRPVDEVILHFSPDRMGVRARSEAYLLDHDGPSHLMVRGGFPPEGGPFTLPRPART